MDDTRALVLDYLAGHRVMTLATVGEDGPWASAVYYAHDGLELEFLSAPHTRHARNLERNPGVAATIQDQDDEWFEIRGIQIEGRVDQLSGEARDAAMRRYSARFTFLHMEPPVLTGVLQAVEWYRLRPVRLYWIDNRRAFGKRLTIFPDAAEPGDRPVRPDDTTDPGV